MPSNNKCYYSGCNNTKKSRPDLVFHRFPVDKEKLTQWIEYSGHQVVGEIDEQLQWNHRLICSNHFNQEDYMPGCRPTLKKSAVPKVFKASVVNNIISTNTNNYNNNTDNVNDTISSRLNFDDHCDSNECQNSFDESHEYKNPSSSVNVEEIMMKYINNARLMIKKLRQKNNLLRQRLFRLNRSNNKWNYSRLRALAKTVITNEKTSFLVEMQIKHLKKSSWSEDEKNFALSIYQRSSQCYQFLRNEYNMALPCVTLIRRWINEMQEF